MSDSTKSLLPPGRRAARRGLGCSLALTFALLGLAAGALIGGPQLLTFVDQTGLGPALLDDQTAPETLAAYRTQALTVPRRLPS